MSLEPQQEVGLLTQTRSYLNAVIAAVQLVTDNYEKLDREVPDMVPDLESLQNLAEDLDAEIADLQATLNRPPQDDPETVDDAG